MAAWVLLLAALPLAALLGAAPAWAERIAGPATVYAQPGGEPVLILADDAPVDTYAERGEHPGWVRVSLLGELHPPDSVPELLRGAAPLFDFDGRYLGALLHVKHPPAPGATEYPETLVEGWLRRERIRPESIPERVLERRFAADPSGHSWLRDYVAAMGLRPWIDKDGVTTYLRYGPGPVPGPRLILFLHEGRLFAALHNRPLHLGARPVRNWARRLSLSQVAAVPASVQATLDVDYRRIVAQAD